MVGRLVAPFSSGGEVIIGEAVLNFKLGVNEVDCVGGGADSEGVVKGDDFVIQSSLLT